MKRGHCRCSTGLEHHCVPLLLAYEVSPLKLHPGCIHLFSKQFTRLTKRHAKIILAAWHHTDPALSSFSKWHKQSDLFQHLGSVRSWPLFSAPRRKQWVFRRGLDVPAPLVNNRAATCGTLSKTRLERIPSIRRYFKACLVIRFFFLPFCNCGKSEKGKKVIGAFYF